MARKKKVVDPRKARLQAESEARRPVKKAAVKKAAVKKVAPAKKAAAVKKAAPAKKASPKKGGLGPSAKDLESALTRLNSGGSSASAEAGATSDSSAAFAASQAARANAEIGTEQDLTTPQRLTANAFRGVGEVTATPAPEDIKEPPLEADPLRPKVTPLPLPTHGQEARADRADIIPRTGTGVPATVDAEEAKRKAAKRNKKGMGIPGSENGVNDLAMTLHERDRKAAQESGKAVNGVEPDDPEVTSVKPEHQDFYLGYHRRLAKVLTHFGVDEDKIDKISQGSGKTRVDKVNYLHSVLQRHLDSQSPQQVDHEGQGITHWIHPTTGVAHPISANHPEMPKRVDDKGNIVPTFIRNKGISEYVRRNADTGEWGLDRKTGNAAYDKTLGWEPDKPEGWNTVQLKGGIKALKLNKAPSGGSMKSLVALHRDEMMGDFAPAIEGESRRRHATIATGLVVDSAGVDAPTRNRNKVETSGKLGGKSGQFKILRATGRTQKRFVVGSPNTAGEGAEGPTQPAQAEITTVPKVDLVGRNPVRNPRRKKSVYNRKTGITMVRPPERGLHIQQGTPGVSTRLPRNGGVVGAGSVTTASGNEISTFDTTPTTPQIERMKRLTALQPEHPTVGAVSEPPVALEGVISRTHQHIGRTNKDGAIVSAHTITTEVKPVLSKKGKPSLDKSGKPKTVKKITSKPGMVDQMLPGMEEAGKPEQIQGPDREVSESQVVQGPVTAGHYEANKAEIERLAKPGEKRSSKISKKFAGLVTVPVKKIVKGELVDKPKEEQPEPIGDFTGMSGIQIHRATRHLTPAGKQVAVVPKTREQALSYKTGRMEPVGTVAPRPTPNPPEQMEFEGMETAGSAHAAGQQWLKPRDLSSETLNLQGKAGTGFQPRSRGKQRK
jgi:hypothetical protein